MWVLQSVLDEFKPSFFGCIFYFFLSNIYNRILFSWCRRKRKIVMLKWLWWFRTFCCCSETIHPIVDRQNSNTRNHKSLHNHRLWYNSSCFSILWLKYHVTYKNQLWSKKKLHNQLFQVIYTLYLISLIIWTQTCQQYLHFSVLVRRCQACFGKNQEHIFSLHPWQWV